MSILLFLLDAHREQAASKTNFSCVGPSIEMNSRFTQIGLLRRLRRGVLILLRAENPLSQSAVDVGISSPISAMRNKFGKRSARSVFSTNRAMTSWAFIDEIHMQSS